MHQRHWIYKEKETVWKKIFRMLKTGLEYDTFRGHSQNPLESKTYVMFIAGIVRNYLFQGLKKLSEKEKDRKNYTVPAAISVTAKGTSVRLVFCFMSKRLIEVIELQLVF